MSDNKRRFKISNRTLLESDIVERCRNEYEEKVGGLKKEIHALIVQMDTHDGSVSSTDIT